MWLEGFFPLYHSWAPTIPSWKVNKGYFCHATQRGEDQYEILLAALHTGGKVRGSLVSVKGLIVL